MHKRYLILAAFIGCVCVSRAQDSLLTLESAMDIALRNNFDIALSYNDLSIAKNNNTAGNAGMLPDVDINGSLIESVSSLRQEYSSGLEVDRDAAVATRTEVAASLQWTIFNGMRMFSTKKRLAALSDQAAQQLKIDIEEVLTRVIHSYYSLVRQQQLLKATREAMILSEERIRIAERKFNNGSGSKLELLQAQTEFNSQKSDEINLLSQIDASEIEMNRLLSRAVTTDFVVGDSVIITYRPSYADLKTSVSSGNNTLSLLRINRKIAGLELKENQGLRWPEITLLSNYFITRNENEAGFSLLNESRGYDYGVTATIPLFRGFNIDRQVRNAKLNLRSSAIIYEAAELSVDALLENAFRNFTNNLELLELEEQNIGYAREILNVEHERYRVGLSNALELREAQRTFEEAMTRLADARFNAKMSETELRRLNGELVK